MDESSLIRVLHVDDDPDVSAVTAAHLEREDDRLRVETAESASEALDVLDAESVDCVVSDYEMPGLDGIEFLERVRSDHGSIPFILFTGTGSESIASDAISAGVTDYLQKGTGTDQYVLLANRINNAVELHRATERAERLERARRVLRDVGRALVRAESRSEIETRVCEILSDAEPYQFAWVGRHDSDSETVEPRTWAGVDEGYLDTIQITTGTEPTERGPTAEAVRTGEVAVIQDIPNDDVYEPWREDAAERRHRSSAAIPLVREGSLYGVLNVYADRTDAFDERERTLLTDLGDDIACAIGRVESRARNERYERIIENLPVGVYRVTPGADGELVDANPALADILGADSVETVLEHEVSEFYRDPAERVELSQDLQAEGIVENRDLQLVGLDGTELRASVTVIRTEESGDVYFDGVMQDVTEQRDRERQLRLFREAVESAGHSVYFTDTGGTIEYVNPAFEETTGYSAEEAVGRTPRILKSGEHDREFYEELWETILDGDVWRSEIVNRTKRGDRYVVDQTIAPVEGTSGDIEHFVAINADITAQRERQRKLKRQNERLDEFTSVVSHDLRNPLNVAQGNLQMARADPHEEYFDAIERSLDRMEALIDHLLTLARKGDATLDVEPTDIASVATECWETVDTAEASLVADVDLTVLADETRLREFFENLYRNAVEHGGERVTVTIGALADGFYIADDGPGIPEEKRDDVFDCGFTTAEEGTGFGLHIVRRVADEHGWEVRATESESGGARFEITGIDIAAEPPRTYPNSDD